MSELITPERLDELVDTDPIRLRDEAVFLLAKVERLRTERAAAVAAVAEQAQRLITREREHNADREARDRLHAERDQALAEVKRLRAELTDLQGQNALTEGHFDNYAADAIAEQDELRKRAEQAEAALVEARRDAHCVRTDYELARTRADKVEAELAAIRARAHARSEELLTARDARPHDDRERRRRFEFAAHEIRSIVRPSPTGLAAPVQLDTDGEGA